MSDEEVAALLYAHQNDLETFTGGPHDPMSAPMKKKIKMLLLEASIHRTFQEQLATFERSWNAGAVDDRQAWFQPIAPELEDVCAEINTSYQELWRLGMERVVKEYFNETGLETVGAFGALDEDGIF